MDLFDSIGARLREERKRTGLSQSDFAEIAGDAGVAGTTRQSQSLYEKGKRMPDAAYLAAIEPAGVDVRYIVTGKRNGPPPEVLSADERELIALFRSASLTGKASAIGALKGGMAPSPAKIKKQVNVSAPSGQAAGRDIVTRKGKS